MPVFVGVGLCMHWYTCMYICMHSCMPVYFVGVAYVYVTLVYMHVCLYMHSCMPVYVCICRCRPMYTLVYMHVCLYAFMYVCVYLCMWVFMYICSTCCQAKEGKVVLKGSVDTVVHLWIAGVHQPKDSSS